jgi:callose synthase
LSLSTGRDVGFKQIYLFEAKLGAGAAEQLLSRDMFRLANGLDFFRLHSFFYGGVGFYISSALMAFSIFVYVYAQLFQGVTDVEQELFAFKGVCDPYNHDNPTTCECAFGADGLPHCDPLLDKKKLYVGFVQTFPMLCMGMMLTIPTYGEIGLESGFLRAVGELLKQICTGGPIFFMFHLLTKMHYFKNVLLYGGATYRATGRGFVLGHETVADLFRFFAVSHLYPAFDLTVALVVYSYFCEGGYAANLWTVWLICFCWLFGPIWFNPHAFVWEKLVDDFGDWKRFLARKVADESLSWSAWHRSEMRRVRGRTGLHAVVCVIEASVWASIGVGAVLNTHYKRNLNPFLGYLVLVAIIVVMFGLISWLRKKLLFCTKMWAFVSSVLVVATFVMVVAFFVLLPPQGIISGGAPQPEPEPEPEPEPPNFYSRSPEPEPVPEPEPEPTQRKETR